MSGGVKLFGNIVFIAYYVLIYVDFKGSPENIPILENSTSFWGYLGNPQLFGTLISRDFWGSTFTPEFWPAFWVKVRKQSKQFLTCKDCGTP